MRHGPETHFDAIALVAAVGREDSQAVGEVLAPLDADELAELAMVLAIMVRAAVYARDMKVEAFLDRLAERMARKSLEDES